jgi:transcriptional regulator with XRE-family HTH domain
MSTRKKAAKPIRTVVGEQVAAIRKRRGWTQEDLARRLADLGCGYLGRGAIAKIETEKREVSVDELVALAAALNVTPVNVCVPYGADDQVEITPKIRVPAPRARRWFYAWEPIVSGKGKEGEFFSELSPDEWAIQKNPHVRELSYLFENIIVTGRSPRRRERAQVIYDTLFADIQRVMHEAETELAQVIGKQA